MTLNLTQPNPYPNHWVPFGTGPKLSGTLPAVLGSNPSIETLWLKNNLISGTLPPAYRQPRDQLLPIDAGRRRLLPNPSPNPNPN